MSVSRPSASLGPARVCCCAAWLIVAGAALPARAQDELVPLRAWDLPRNLEWTRLERDGPSTQLWIGMDSGEIRVLTLDDPPAPNPAARAPADAPTANDEESLVFKPGVTLAAGHSATPTGRVYYAIERFAVTALAWRSPPAAAARRLQRLWTSGEAPEDFQNSQDDPERFSRVVAAHASDAGLLLIRSDGRTALLALEDGRLRAQASLSRPSEAYWHVGAGGAAMQFASAGTHHCAWLDWPDRPDIRTLSLGSQRPIFSALTAAGLLVAWSDHAKLLTRAERSTAELRWSGASTASGVALAESADGGTLLVSTSAGELLAFDLKQCARVWGTSVGRLHAQPRLQVVDDLLLMSDEHSLRALDLTTGQLRAHTAIPAGGALLCAGVHAGALYALLDGPQSPASTLPAATPTDARLRRIALPSPLVGGLTLHAFQRSGPARCTFAVIKRERLLLIAGERLHAYKLP